MKVRAKFKVDSIERTIGCRQVKNAEGVTSWEPTELRSVKMSPVCGNGDPEHENTKFWQASPSGSLVLGCANLAAADAFELGKEYYLDFTPADAAS